MTVSRVIVTPPIDRISLFVSVDGNLVTTYRVVSSLDVVVVVVVGQGLA
jgi:hypothetical protein